MSFQGAISDFNQITFTFIEQVWKEKRKSLIQDTQINLNAYFPYSMYLSVVCKGVKGLTTNHQPVNDKFGQSLLRRYSSEASAKMYFITNSISTPFISTPGPSTRETTIAQTRLQGSKMIGHDNILWHATASWSDEPRAISALFSSIFQMGLQMH